MSGGTRGPAIVLGVIVSTCVAVVGGLAVELTFRMLDGYKLSSARLVLNGRPVKAPQASSYLSRFPLGPDVDAEWYALEPEQQTGGIREDADLQERRKSGPPTMVAVSGYEWNREYVHWAACEHHDFFKVQFAPDATPAQDLFVFEPVDGARFPTFRLLRNSRTTGLSTNNFGWRGPDIALAKPPEVIRIAFVGASTTVNPHGDRYSYPDYIRRWLTEWLRRTHPGVGIEVINAGRSGIGSDSIEAIVRTEVAPLNPDLVVYYEGANQFLPVDYFASAPRDWTPGQPPPSALFKPGWFDEHSAVALRLDDLFGSRMSEPRKTPIDVRWPADLSETDPDIHYPKLPTNLNPILKDFDGMRTTLDSQGGRFVPASFLWCVYEGMRLNPATNAGLYGYLNGPFWPFSYALMRRFATFQNRVFQNYAAAYHLPFIDIAGNFPLDPSLFGDAIHMSPLGIKLMAWSVFQSLTRQLNADIGSGRLPRPAVKRYTTHPAFPHPGRLTMSARAAAGSCAVAAGASAR